MLKTLDLCPNAERTPEGRVPSAQQQLVIGLRRDGSIGSVNDMSRHAWLERAFNEVPLPAAFAAACERLLDSTEPVAVEHADLGLEHQPHKALLVLIDAIPIRRTLVRIGELVMRTADVFVGQARSAAVELRIVQHPDLPPALYADGEKLAWILSTLVGNAIRIVRQADDDRAERPRVTLEVGYQPEARQVVFTVRDNGPGMSEATARWLFRRDPRTGRALGLALLMVHDIVAAHRGTILVESRLGQGTAFVVSVPRASNTLKGE